ncbi:MAG: hypothetical protein RL015_551 [Verrucomicrobiota bacterium]|jgi:hypothetical protein
MNRTEHELELMRRYLEGVASLEETQELESLIVKDVGVRQDFLRYTHLDSALAGVRRSQPSVAAPRRSVWLSWRPLTAAAAGIVFGMLCTSVVFGFVNQQAAVKKVPLLAFDAGLEDVTQTLKDGLPDRVGQWGMDEASIVAAEENVLPLQGERMLRLEPIPPQKPVKNHTSRVYQMLDLRSQPVAMMNGEVEAEVTASFCATNSDLSSRYLIRAIALDEAPETATKNFWSKVESDGVVSESQRFDTLPGKSGWHTFSMKLRLPPGSQTLVLIFGAVPSEDTSRPALVHYLDDVQASLLTPPPLP